MELWFRNVDPSGRLDHGPTGLNAEAIIEIMHKIYLDSLVISQSKRV